MYLQIIVDPSGNSFVENPHAPRSDPHREVSHFLRSREQDHALGFYTDAEVNNRVNAEREAAEVEQEEKEASSTASTTSSTLLLRCQEGEVGDEASLEGKAEGALAAEATGIDLLGEVALPRVLSASTTSTALGTQTHPTEKKQQPQQLDLTDEVLNFPTNCPECSSPADTKMKVTSEYNEHFYFLPFSFLRIIYVLHAHQILKNDLFLTLHKVLSCFQFRNLKASETIFPFLTLEKIYLGKWKVFRQFE